MTTLGAIPKLASTVVLMDHNYKIYLTKRPITMKFMGGFYVFPGGSVNLEDNVDGNKYIKGSQKNESFSLAHYVAAARELFEEVGVLLCSRYDGSPVQLNADTEMRYRQLLVNGEISFSQMLKREEIYLELESLTYFGHRITPKWRTHRFDTRFFLARLPEGQSPKPDSNEIDNALWIYPKEALLAFQNGQMSMARATIASLRAIMNYQNGAPLIMPRN